MTITIKTNNVPRHTIHAYQLTEEARKEFDYIDWAAIDEGTDSAYFFQYKGMLYDLSQFSTTRGGSMEREGMFQKWDGFFSETAFSGKLIKYVDDCDNVIVGSYYD